MSSHKVVPVDDTQDVTEQKDSDSSKNDDLSPAKESLEKPNDETVHKAKKQVRISDEGTFFTKASSIAARSAAISQGRETWANHLEFILSMMGYAVGLGNVWRFPYLCYENGGGAFLVPYVFMLFFVALPMFFLEASLGQFCGSGILTCWRFAPILTGLGYGLVMLNIFCSIYYNSILAWAMMYCVFSFFSIPQLPWTHCDPTWIYRPRYKRICEDAWRDSKNETPLSVCRNFTSSMGQPVTVSDNGLCLNSDGLILGVWNSTRATIANYSKSFASQEYFERVAIGHYWNDLSDLGGFNIWPPLFYFISFAIIFGCMVRGIRGTGKIVYVTVIFPYVMLTILLIYAISLDGFTKGIYFYIKPDFSALLHFKVWVAAATQIFFSLSISLGGLHSLASHNDFRNNALRDALIVAFGNCCTSIFAGFVVFGFVGHLAYRLNTEVPNVVDDGFTLAFAIYPEAITALPQPWIFNLLFFSMLITLGLDSEFVLIELVATAASDMYPNLRRQRFKLIAILCSSFFLLGLVFQTKGGYYLVTVIDYYTNHWNILFFGLCELITLMYVYGVKRWLKDLSIMMGNVWLFQKTKYYWVFAWCFSGPIILALLAYGGISGFQVQKYQWHNAGYYPLWSTVVGHLDWAALVLPIFIVPIYLAYISDKPTWKEKLKSLLKPTKTWGPKRYSDRSHCTEYVKDFVVHTHRRVGLSDSGDKVPLNEYMRRVHLE